MTLAAAGAKPRPGAVAVRPATAADHEAIWAILEPVYRAGETYCIPRDISRDDALADWFAAPFSVFVAELDGRVLGSSHIGRNRPGGGAHVANAGFVTHPDARGRGIAAAMVVHAKSWARAQGFRPCSSTLSSPRTKMPSIRGRRPGSRLSAACPVPLITRGSAMWTRW